MNKVILLGRLTKAPEIRYSQKNNMKVALFTLAVNRRYVKPGEERQTDFINIVSYSKLADFAEKYLKKGTQICVCGRIQVRIYEDNNGIKRYIAEVISEEIDFADSIKKDEGTELPDTNINTTNDTSEISNEIPEEDFLNSDDLPF